MNSDFMQEISSAKTIRLSAVAVLVMLALFLLISTIGTLKSFSRSAVPATDVITVNGNGQANLPPDVARVSFTVEHTSASVGDAQAATTKQANAAIDFVKGKGVDEKDIKTLSYTISPQYAYPSGGAPRVTGYQVAQSIQVTVHDLASVGALLSGLGGLAVQNVSGPSFALDDPTAGYDAARADAIAKAQAQAKTLAKQLGVSLGKIVNFSESSGGSPYPMMYGMGMGGDTVSAKATPTIPVGENTYTASVSITYEIR